MTQIYTLDYIFLRKTHYVIINIQQDSAFSFLSMLMLTLVSSTI